MTEKFSRRRLGAMLLAPVVQRIQQYPYTIPDPPALTDEEQDKAIRENAASNQFLWGMIQMLAHQVRELEKKFIDPYYMRNWEGWEKDG